MFGPGLTWGLAILLEAAALTGLMICTMPGWIDLARGAVLSGTIVVSTVLLRLLSPPRIHDLVDAKLPLAVGAGWLILLAVES